MIDLSFEAYLDHDYYKEIIFHFFPKIWGCGRDSKYRHFGLKMVLLHIIWVYKFFNGHRGLAGRKWLRRLYKKLKTQTFRNFGGLGWDFHSWAFGPKTVKFVRVYVDSQEPFKASLDILNQRHLILDNLSSQQLSRVGGCLLQMGEKLVQNISNVCVCAR